MSNPQPIQPGVYYHIFNRGNNGENLFIESRNYKYFLDLYTKYIEPVAATYAYCLLRNHFHVLIRVYTPEERVEIWPHLFPEVPFKDVSPSQAFSNLFNAFSKAIQKAYGRTGSVFEHPYHRIPVLSDGHFTRLITYIHKKPQKHGFVDDFRDWPYSSFHTLVSLLPTRLKRVTALEWFAGVEGLHQAHLIAEISEEVMYLVEGDD